MEKQLEKTGKTIDEAINAALLELGLDRDSVSVEVLEKPKSGFLGIGGTPARVKVTYEEAEPVSRPASHTAPVSRPAPAAPARTAPVSSASAPRPDAHTRPPLATPEPSDGEVGREFLSGLLPLMGITADSVTVEVTAEAVILNISGPDMGALIGRRGETLDSVQRVVATVVNREREKPVRVTVDTEGYRVKREESLISLATKTAERAIKYRKNIALEPMNSYSRHVIHTALHDMEGVSTRSVGVEPHRRIVISVPGGTDERPRGPRPGFSGGRGGNSRGGDRPPYRGPQRPR